MSEAPPTPATDEAPAYRKMIGTEGNPDYVVIAKNGNFCLGVKFISRPAQNPQQGEPPLIFAGFRVRAAADPDLNPFPHSAEECRDAFPGVSWSKVGNGGGHPRASTEIGMPLPCNIKNAHLAPQAVKQARFVTKMMKWVVDHLSHGETKAADVLEIDVETFKNAIVGKVGAEFFPVAVGKLMSDGPPSFHEALSNLVEEYEEKLEGELDHTAPDADSIEDATTALQNLAEAGAKNAFAEAIAAGGAVPMFDDASVDGIEETEDGEEIVATA